MKKLAQDHPELGLNPDDLIAKLSMPKPTPEEVAKQKAEKAANFSKQWADTVTQSGGGK